MYVISPIRRNPANARQNAASALTLGIEELFKATTASTKQVIGYFVVFSFEAGLSILAPLSMCCKEKFLNILIGRIRSTCFERMAERYTRRVFNATRPINGELVPYDL